MRWHRWSFIVGILFGVAIILTGQTVGARLWLFVGEKPTQTAAVELSAQLKVPDNVPLARKPLGQTEHTTLLAVAVRTGEKPHRHDKSDMFVVVLKGKGNMTVGDRKFSVQAGDIVFVPKGVPHFFVNTDREPSVALAVFTPPFQQGDTVPVDRSE